MFPECFALMFFIHMFHLLCNWSTKITMLEGFFICHTSFIRICLSLILSMNNKTGSFVVIVQRETDGSDLFWSRQERLTDPRFHIRMWRMLIILYISSKPFFHFRDVMFDVIVRLWWTKLKKKKWRNDFIKVSRRNKISCSGHISPHDQSQSRNKIRN